ncbi:MAG: methyltransferase domain-containing protein [Streptosporangiales bacterium]|nr:methyltransferase domain-containing protein [Streptosporangiales bacterium]
MSTGLRRDLVDALTAHGWLRDERVVEAFRTVPREAFVPGVPLERVYADQALVTKRDEDGIPISSSSQPSIMAAMLQQLDTRPGHRVLEVGAGTGYNAALLGQLVGPEGVVVSVDIDDDLVLAARDHLADAGLADWVRFRTGDGWLGRPEDAPFDRIVATVGVWDLASAWLDQLTEGGVLVVPLWLRPGLQLSVAFHWRRTDLISSSVECCGFQRLRGPHAGPEAYVPVTASVLASMEGATDDTVKALRELLASEPTVMEAPPLVEGWAARLALDEDYPVQLADLTDPDPGSIMFGLYSRNGLAVVRGERLLGYGERDTVDRLARYLRYASPLRVGDLRIVARRTTNVEGPASAGPPERGWRLARPSCVLDVFEGPLPS